MKTDTHIAAASPSPPTSLVIAAFAGIYLIWGSTYLGIRFAVETIPPFLMGGGRFLIAGLMLFASLRYRGVAFPVSSEWRNAFIVGILLMGVGNGGVNWAEQKVASGLTALLIAVTPLWFALIDWLRPGGTRPSTRMMIGIAVGFAGVAMLVGLRDGQIASAGHVPEALVILVAGFAWAAGSLYARYTPKPSNSLMGVALQMIMGGLVMIAIGICFGEANAPWREVSIRSLLAFVYLTLVGSLVGFTAYSWLLKVSTPARISTYAYVNPVIAVILGWAVAGEEVTLQMCCAALVILAGVIVIIRAPRAVAGPR